MAAAEGSDRVASITAALVKLPFFAGCPRLALEEAATKAEEQVLAEAVELPLPERVLFVVLEGTALVRAGVGPLSELGPGATLNEASLLAGASLRPPEPCLKGRCFKATADSVEASCLPNLCPHNAVKERPPDPFEGASPSSTVDASNFLATPPTASPRTSPKWTQLVRGGPAPKADPDGGGVVLASLPLELLKERLAAHGALERFDENHDELLDRWTMLLRSSLLLGAPNEVLFALTEVSERRSLEPEQPLCKEGDIDESILLVDEGEAVVEKRVPTPGGNGSQMVVVGYISAGAVIGDAVMACSKVSRGATVKTATALTLLALPALGLLTVLRRFPSLTKQFEDRIKETVKLLAEALPPKVDVLSQVKLFANSDKMFLSAIASAAERHVFYCGDVLKRENMSDGTLYVVEFGACTVESAATGVLIARLAAGFCLGERTLLGAQKANATVAVATPLAMMLTVKQSTFNQTLRRFPWDVQRFESLRRTPDSGAQRRDASSLKLFEGCSPEFLQEISDAMAVRCFLPGQTIMVQGMADAGQMYVVKGGRVSIEIDGKALHSMGTGAVFGELAMLGIVRRRSSTVRALGFCTTLEIPRGAFLASIDRHPRERQRFEAFASQQRVGTDHSVQWPILQGMPSQFQYLVNLYADRRICNVGDRSLSSPPALDAAIMVFHGTLVVVDAFGAELAGAEVSEGECFNVQALLGMPKGLHLRPKTTCEVQIMSQSVWEKILSEFPEHREDTKVRILKEMAGEAEEALEGKRGGLGVLRRAALFRTVSEPCAQAARELLEERLYCSGEIVTEEFGKDDCMYWVLSGTVRASAAGLLNKRVARPRSRVGRPASAAWTWQVGAGGLFSEAVAYGTCETQPCTMIAGDTCLVQRLSRRKITGLLEEFPQDRPALEPLLEEVRSYGAKSTLQERVLRSPLFSQLPHHGAVGLCERLEDVFFAPNENLFVRGEACEFGQSCMYVVLAGSAEAESDMGITMRKMTQGSLCGEAGAFGLAQARTTTVRANRTGLLHCAKLHGHIAKAVMGESPEVLEAVTDLFNQRSCEYQRFQESKHRWLDEMVVPRLVRSSVLAGVGRSVIADVAFASAKATAFCAGETITEAGQKAESMLLLLEGTVEVRSQHGQVVGTASPGAMFGEICLLGLLMQRTSTLVALTPCKVLNVEAKTLESVLAQPNAEASRQAFEKMREARLDQVARGVPMSALSAIKWNKSDLSLQVLALQAERVQMSAGQVWMPAGASNQSGPQYGFIVKGHAVLKNPEEERPVMSLTEACVLQEPVVAKFGAHIRAVTNCEAYRLSQQDLDLASNLSSPSGASWYSAFQMHLREARTAMVTRLQSARGAINSTQPCKTDASIRLWKVERQLSMDTAASIKSSPSQKAGRRSLLAPGDEDPKSPEGRQPEVARQRSRTNRSTMKDAGLEMLLQHHNAVSLVLKHQGRTSRPNIPPLRPPGSERASPRTGRSVSAAMSTGRLPGSLASPGRTIRPSKSTGGLCSAST